MFYIYYLFTFLIWFFGLFLLPFSLFSRRHRLVFLRFLPFLAPLEHPAHARPQGADYHFHFASFGEANALAPMLSALQSEGASLLLTCSSRTGLARARELCSNSFLLPAEPLLPLWLPRCGALVVYEAELYWALVRCYGGRSLLLDARMKKRSARRYLRARWLYARVFGSFGAVWAQSAADARRLGLFGLRAKVSVPLKLRAARIAGCALPAAGAGSVVVASTHEGEEELILDALGLFGAADLARLGGCGGSCAGGEQAPAPSENPLFLQKPAKTPAPETAATPRQNPVFSQNLAAKNPAVLIVAPRHPERFEAVAALLRRRFGELARYSEQPLGYLRGGVFLLDTLGRLGDFYAVCERVVLGGSFVPVGGHNFAEPAAFCARIASGPHVDAQRAVLAHISGVKICKIGEKIDFASIPKSRLEGGSLNELLINLKKEVNENRKSL